MGSLKTFLKQYYSVNSLVYSSIPGRYAHLKLTLKRKTKYIIINVFEKLNH